MVENREVKRNYPATLGELIQKYSENFKQQASFGNLPEHSATEIDAKRSASKQGFRQS